MQMKRNPIAREVRTPKYKPRIVKSKKLYTRKGVIAALALAASVTATRAHDTWANGLTVPEWVKQGCCGVADIHRYSLDEVYHDHAGWHLPGLNQAIPDSQVQSSADEYVWAFFPERALAEAETLPIWCFFIPQGSV